MVYEPQEDSLLLKSFVHKFAKGNVLDMGTGSGIQAAEASHRPSTDKIFAVDIDAEAIAYAKKQWNHTRHKKVKWIVGDLFSSFKNKSFSHLFDVIIFNAPYLPQETKQLHIDLEGGRKGNELIARFLAETGKYLKPDGKILLVFSSLTPDVDKLIEQNLFTGKELGRVHITFEDIFVYLIKPSNVLKKLNKLKVTEIKYFTKGKRGWIFTGKLKNKKVAVKIKNPKSTAVGTILHEAKMLRILNKHKIGPKYIYHDSHMLIYEFVDGKLLKEFLESKGSSKSKNKQSAKNTKKKIIEVCKKALDVCFKLDQLGIDKKEMIRPLKHIVISGNKITFLDFERARKINHLHNVTQFCQFIGTHVDEKHKKEWVALAQKYKYRRTKEALSEMKVLLDGKPRE